MRKETSPEGISILVIEDGDISVSYLTPGSVTGIVTPMENTETQALKIAMREAQDAWQAARENNDPRLANLAKIAGRLEGEYRLAKAGRSRRTLPKGSQYCDRCGGFGGSAQWPGFVCFQCDGTGIVR